MLSPERWMTASVPSRAAGSRVPWAGFHGIAPSTSLPTDRARRTTSWPVVVSDAAKAEPTRPLAPPIRILMSHLHRFVNEVLVILSHRRDNDWGQRISGELGAGSRVRRTRRTCCAWVSIRDVADRGAPRVRAAFRRSAHRGAGAPRDWQSNSRTTGAGRPPANRIPERGTG